MSYITEIFSFMVSWFTDMFNNIFGLALYPGFTIGSIVAVFIVLVVLGSVWRLL